MAYRYFIEMQFNGKNFHGWQSQPNALTIQSELNEKTAMILKEPVESVGAGRTDSGVHARYFVAHIDTQKAVKDIPSLVFKLNKILHKDISILNIYEVDKDAHARFSAVFRTYKYFISTRKDVFRKDLAWQLFYNLQTDQMNLGAAEILKHSDFTSFSKLNTDVKTNICHIEESYWTIEKDLLIYTIKADRFLRNMVRAIVGTLISMGKGKLSLDQFTDIINAKDRCRAGESAPAHGLHLWDIRYPFAPEQISV
ncbi:MAG: tRNA pseudouridine(38-40) synthase TruA [Bacteroidales bacterium]|jgi:tRNA pseudouridine38-40 synthase